MPLAKRVIEPVNVSNIHVPREADNQLEYVANVTLSNLTRQLSSLSLLAADIFSELIDSLTEIKNRNERLINRIKSVNAILSVSSARDGGSMLGFVSLQTQPYKSRMEADQHVFEMKSMPHSIAEMLNSCQPPPSLEQLDRFRRDKKQSMKFYTDPTFFFQLWCQEMLQNTRQLKKKKRRFMKTVLTKKTSDSEITRINLNSKNNPNNDLSAVKYAQNEFEVLSVLPPSIDCLSTSLPPGQFHHEDVSIYNTIAPPKDVHCSPKRSLKFHVTQNDSDDVEPIYPPPPSFHSYDTHGPDAYSTSYKIFNTNLHNDHNHSSLICNQETVTRDVDGNIREQRISSAQPPLLPPSLSIAPSLSLSVHPNPPNNPTHYICEVNAKSTDLLTAIRNGIELRKVGGNDKPSSMNNEAVLRSEKKCDVQAIFEEVYKRRPYINNSDSTNGSDEEEDRCLWLSDNEK